MQFHVGITFVFFERWCGIVGSNIKYQFTFYLHKLLWKQCLFISIEITTKSTITLIEQVLCYKRPFFNAVTAISSAFSPAMNNKSLHAALITICTNRGDTAFMLKHTTHCLAVLRSTPYMFSKYQGMSVGNIFST